MTPPLSERLESRPRIFSGIADLQTEVGTHLGYSEWHTVDQEQIDSFAAATGDHQWIHTDPARAATGPFGTTIAHGYLTLSLLPNLLDQVFTVDGLRMSVNYGADRLRFPAVVPVDSRVRVGAELLEVQPIPLGHRIRVRATVELFDSEKPACVLEVLRVAVT
jgi:acyl dehydratase